MNRLATASSRTVPRVCLALVVAAVSHAGLSQESEGLDLDVDELWNRRAEQADGRRASAARARQLVEAHAEALARQPDSLELQWKLLRALHFQGDYVLADGDSKLEHYERARAVADAARQQLATRSGKSLDEMDPPEIAEILRRVPEAAPIYLYSAILWGRWGETTGKMKAARAGVAGKLRDFAGIVILLDERYAGAGGRRFLGRMHTEAPRIPFVTGWIDRRQAVSELERAVELAPDEPLNQLFLADALLRFHDDRREEALETLAEVLSRPPRAEHLLEDRAAAADARELLSRARR